MKVSLTVRFGIKRKSRAPFGKGTLQRELMWRATPEVGGETLKAQPSLGLGL